MTPARRHGTAMDRSATGVMANPPKKVPDDLEAIAAALGEKLS